MKDDNNTNISLNFINKEDFYLLVKESDLVIVYFWANWCHPCKKFAPKYEAFVNNTDAILKKIDIDNENLQQIVVDYGIQSIPTLIGFSKGIEIGREIGTPGNLEEFINRLKSNIN